MRIGYVKEERIGVRHLKVRLRLQQIYWGEIAGTNKDISFTGKVCYRIRKNISSN